MCYQEEWPQNANYQGEELGPCQGGCVCVCPQLISLVLAHLLLWLLTKHYQLCEVNSGNVVKRRAQYHKTGRKSCGVTCLLRTNRRTSSQEMTRQ